jgi:epoxyqueuosine reductase
MDTRGLSQWIKATALEVGFAAAGITTPDPPPHLDVFRAWIEAGRHGEMEYLSRPSAMAKRADPRALLPGCRSILVVAADYTPPAPVSASPPPHIAAYAAGKDYHDVLVGRLRQLASEIEQLLGRTVAWLAITDSAPLLERDLAQRAGLGWIGKNTCLIHPRRGSYLLLAELLLDLELEPDAPFAADRCGTCTRCLEACPTECILPDRTLDASRCISYWNIELRGPLPRPARQALGGWVFGCDICQDVCPWNVRFAAPTEDGEFRPGAVPLPSTVEGFLGLGPAEYRRRLGESPLRRAKHVGLLRNAAVVAGNLRREAAVPALGNLLDHSQPDVRSHAAWALGRLGTPESRRELQARLGAEPDPAVRDEIRRALESPAAG